ncbi:MAG: MBL fold metallo-hydrolase [Anaerolineae bacterium]|nr:MBL fold metallo-hydrolase [Anaerolineae bacterium]
MLELTTLRVGEYGTNCYLLTCPRTHRGLLVDPAADPDAVLEMCRRVYVTRIVLTHGHHDHYALGLGRVQATIHAPMGMHPADAEAFGIHPDFPLEDGRILRVGHFPVKVVHIPGHTPGSIALHFDRRAIVGDAVFPGGPGHTQTAAALEQSLFSLQRTVFTWPNDTTFYPGHGDPGVVGDVRPAFQAFLARHRPADLYGDVTWEM